MKNPTSTCVVLRTEITNCKVSRTENTPSKLRLLGTRLQVGNLLARYKNFLKRSSLAYPDAMLFLNKPFH